MKNKYFRLDGTPCDEAEATLNGIIRDGYRTDIKIMVRDGMTVTKHKFTDIFQIDGFGDASNVTGHINDQQFLDAVRRCEDARNAMIDRYNQSGARHPSNVSPTPVTQETAPVATHDQNTTAQQREAAAHSQMVARYNNQK